MPHAEKQREHWDTEEVTVGCPVLRGQLWGFSLAYKQRLSHCQEREDGKEVGTTGGGVCGSEEEWRGRQEEE